MRLACWICTLLILLALCWIDYVGSSLRGFVEQVYHPRDLSLATVIVTHFRPWAILSTLLFLGYAFWVDRFPTFKSRAGRIFLLCSSLFILSLGGLMLSGLCPVFAGHLYTAAKPPPNNLVP